MPVTYNSCWQQKTQKKKLKKASDFLEKEGGRKEGKLTKKGK